MPLLEYFKPFESLQVSNMGRVIGSRGKEMIPQPNSSGYLKVACKRKSYYIHHMVAKLFITNPHPELYTELDHLDSVRARNYACNLRYCTRSMNQRAIYERREKMGLNRLSDAKVSWYRKMGELQQKPIWYDGKQYACAKDLSATIGTTAHCIRKAISVGWYRGRQLYYVGQPSNKPKPRPQKKPVEYMGVTYDSCKSMANAFGVSGTAIQLALKSGNWRGHPISCAA